MKKHRFFTVCIVLLSVLVITTCGDWGTGNSQTFEYRLQGTWETYNPDETYFGVLEVSYDSIIIKEYKELPFSRNDPRRPFKDFPRDFPLDGYSEKIDNKQGIIYIEYGGVLHEIPYQYDSRYDESLKEQVERLLFTFPNSEAENKRPETLIKIAD